MALARLGAGHLHLIDPDLVEVHNLDAMAAADVLSVGRPKAEVVASAARAVAAGGTVASHVVSGSSLASLETLLAADLIITTVDHDGVRWAVSAVAAVYLKPLFDVGSGFSGEQGAPVAGADVRLVLPGDACLDCLGGRGDEAHIETTRRGPRAEQRQAASRRWREERAGSLRSVNQVATGIGLRFVEALVAGRVDRSTWVQVTFGPDGVPAVSTARPGPRRASCRVCELAGTGDAGLEVLRETPMARNP
jgi:molybdopterin/thiamine biosynthesis adenylyltransferase